MTHKKFAEVRRALHISQGRVAKQAGISQGLLSNFELGYVALRPDQVAKLEDALRRELAKSARDADRVAQTLGSYGVSA